MVCVGLWNSWGLQETWQESRQVLHSWVHINMTGFGLMQLLSLIDSAAVEQLCFHSPWRKDNPKTAGQVRKGLAFNLRHVAIRQR